MTTTLDTPAEQSGLLDDYYTPQEVARLLKFRTPRPVYDAIAAASSAPSASPAAFTASRART